MSARKGFHFELWLVAVLFAVASAAAAASPAQVRDRTCVPRWTVVHQVRGATLGAVAAVAPGDVWAVGMRGGRPVVVRWNGRSWRTVPAPNGRIESISASASGVWAVGGDAAWKWSGAKWRRLPPPRRPAAEGALSLSDVVVVSPTNVWAVGDVSDVGIVERWNGRAWRIVEALDGDSSFDAVAAARPDRIWAVGEWWKGAYISRLVGTWNGTRWKTLIDLEDVGTSEGYEENFLLDVDARRPDDVWAVGSNLGRPFVEHWNGRQWSHEHPGGGAVGGVGGRRDIRFTAHRAPDVAWLADCALPDASRCARCHRRALTVEPMGGRRRHDPSLRLLTTSVTSARYRQRPGLVWRRADRTTLTASRRRALVADVDLEATVSAVVVRDAS
jgi:hypothetical protein